MRLPLLNSLQNKWRNLSVRNKGILILAIPISCFAVSLPTVSWSHFDLIDDEDILARLQLIRSIAKDLLQSTADAQWGVQSFVLTQHEPFLSSYHEAVEYIPQHIENLPDDLDTDLTQKEKLLKIERFSEEHLTTMGEILSHAQNSETGILEPEELEKWLIESDDTISQLHHRIEHLAAEEEETLIENRKHLEEHQDRGYALLCVFVAMGILGSIFAIKLFFNLDRELADKQAKLEATNQKLEEFSATVSHQLRNPLAAILSNAQVGLLTAPETEVNTRQKLNKIVELTKLNNSLVDSLLSLARYEKLESGINLQPRDLVPFLNNIGDRFKDIAQQKNQQLTLTLPNTGVMAAIEENLLEQAIANLLDNAIKYTPEGGEVELQLSSDRNLAIIKVIDSGRGIPQEDLTKIFDRFYRVNDLSAERQQGFGLGLAIVQEIVRVHQGNIYASLNSDRGSTFTIELPLVTI